MIGKMSVKKPYTVLVAVVMVIILGVVSFTKMTTDLLPSISLPYVIVMTTYVGASPETVEMVVTKPVEASMATVSNIESISSVSSENYSLVILEFAQTTDMNSVSLEIREKLDQIKSYWDDSVGNPIIMKLNPDMMPVMIAAVGGQDMSYSEVSQMVENVISPELESLEGVASVSAGGLLEESVNVIIRQEKIDAINKQVFGYIEGEMEDAAKELEDGKTEILDGQNELNKAQKELNDTKTELADGKAEIETGKADLEKGKKELEDKRESTAAELAEAEKQLLTAKADLEAAKIQITTQITTVQKLKDGLEQAVEGQKKLTDGINKLAAGIEELKSVIEGEGFVSLVENFGIMTPDDILNNPLISSVLGETEKEALRNLSIKYPDKTLSAILEIMEEQLAELREKHDELKVQAEKLDATVESLKNNLSSATMGLGVEEFMSTMEEQLQKINNNITTVDSAIIELSKGNLTAAIEFSNAQSQISIGEMQLDSAEAQIEAGEKQLESGQKTIEDNIEKLKDALEQIAEGEEQLAEAREDALAGADMHGILTAETVKALLAAQNFSMPGGYVTEEGIDYLVRVGDKPDDVEGLKAMPLMNLNMEGVDVITLGDVADVFMTDNAEDIYANVNGNPGILLTIQKQTGYSTGEVSDRILDKFDQLREADENLILITFMDQGIYIDLVMNSIISNVVFGAGLAILILILFLRDIKPTLVIACSIPISLVAAVVCMYFSGVTLNVISLSGLALGIGMLVDNSIVVIENIYRMRNEGYSMTEAAIEGTKEVTGAIAASTLTTICVFAPIVFTEGITRQLFVDMGLTIAYSLVASLVVALTLVPALASKVLNKTKPKEESKLFVKVVDGYEKLLHLSLRYKPVVLILVVVLLIISAAASLSKGTAFMTEMDSTQMSLNITLPKDTLLSKTGEVTDEVVARIMEIPEVTDVGANTGGSSYSMLLGGSNNQSATNATTVYIVMSEDKKRTNEEIAVDIREMLADIVQNENAEIEIETSNMDLSALGGSGIAIQVQGRELDTLQTIAGDIAAILEDVEGTSEVSDGLGESTGELRVIIDRDKAIDHGLTVAQVFQQIAAKLAAATSSTALRTEIRDYDVYVKHGGDLELTRESLKNIDIDVIDKDGKKEKVKLSDIAVFEDAVSLNSINRIDHTRYIEVSAAIAEGYNVALVSSDVEKAIAGYQMPDGYELVFAGENEFINEAMDQLMLMLILAVMFMFLIMVAQFQSLLSPFIIMFTIPLAFTGGFMGLYLSSSVVSIIAVIGFIMLSGVIVNNGIVMVDYVNQLRDRGMNKYDALIEAGRTRLRPVLMTALTTILAMSTMVFSNDMGSEMGKPMAIVTIGGLTYGTLLTLVVIPCIYDIFMREKNNDKDNVTTEG